jgi:hypothetical protein
MNGALEPLLATTEFEPFCYRGRVPFLDGLRIL